MNELEEKHVLREIGKHNLVSLQKLKSWLESADPSRENWEALSPAGPQPFSYKRSPSVVTRSEAELFGVSLPRFAIKVYFRPDQTEFVNARRTVLFADQARCWGSPKNLPVNSGIRSLKVGELLPDNRFRISLKCPGWILHTNSCIADSVIQPPSRLRDSFHIILSQLSELYGKTDAGLDYSGTPYIKHIRLSGGGLCAQAVCFMATLLMLREASAVYGIAEITQLAMGKAGDHLLLTGLSQQHLSTYFSKVGLNLHLQAPAAPARFTLAMKSYIRSNCPIVFPLDAGVLAGHIKMPRTGFTSILKSNNVKIPRYDTYEPMAHAVLVLGCNEDFFLLHDPSTLPFLTATPGQLWDAGRYTSPELTNQLTGHFFAVVPNDVNLPVGESGRVSNGQFKHTHLGVLNLAYRALRVQENVVFNHTKLLTLCRLSAVPGSCGQDQNLSVGPALLSFLAAKVEEMKPCLDVDPWVWFHCVSDEEFLIWDAEMEPPTSSTPESACSFLLLHISTRSGKPVMVFQRTSPRGSGTPPACQAESPVPVDRQTASNAGFELPQLDGQLVKRALLTSFDLVSSNERPGWPKEWPSVEKYMLMQHEAKHAIPSSLRPSLIFEEIRHFASYTAYVLAHNFYQWFPAVRWLSGHYRMRRRNGLEIDVRRSPGFAWTWPVSTALERLQSVHWNTFALRSIARAVAESMPCKIVALATFFPEISSSDKCVRAMTARALKSICCVAGFLNRRHSHDIKVVEIVGGSLVDGIWPAVSSRSAKAETAYVANLLDEQSGMDRVIEVLRMVAPFAIENGVKLAVELEPGPLYILRDEPTLLKFCQLVQSDSLLTRCVGLNLDISHWHLAGIKPDNLPAAIHTRIIHCHANDTFKGHFIDFPPGETHGLNFLADWLRILRSGYVTCELEGCPSSEWLNIADANLSRLGI